MSFMTDDAIDDPSDFNTVQLQKLDDHLRCPICSEIYNTAMILSSCSHSFCTLCIRRSLSNEQICPKCRKPAYEGNLIHNYDLDNVVVLWKETRTMLIEMEKKAKESELPSQSARKIGMTNLIILDDDQTEDFTPKSTSKSSKTTASNIRRSTRLGSQTQSASPQPQSEDQTQGFHEEKDKGKTKEEELTSQSLVECPICEKKMIYGVLDEHIDRCMKGDSRIPECPPSTVTSNTSYTSSFSTSSSSSFSSPKMQTPQALKRPVNLGKKPTKVVYAMQSDKDMRNILKELGIPIHGDKAQWVQRHKEYISLYNANYDSSNPVSAPTLIQRLLASELVLERNNHLKRKASDPEQHLKQFRSEYDRLIADAKQRSSNSNKSPDSSNI